MANKPTYKELEQKVKELNKEVAELKREEARWRSLVENAPNFIMVVDSNGTIQYINQTVAGIEVEDTIGTSQYDYAPSEYHKVMRESIEHVFETGRATRYEIAGVGPHGTTSWYLSHVGPIKRGRRVVGATIMPTDITKRKQAEEALRESEAKYHSLYDTMKEGVAIHEVVCDASGEAKDYIILDVNPSYEKILGLKKEKAVERKASELYGTGQAPYIEIYSKVAASKQPTSFETYFPPMNKHFSISVFSPRRGQFATVFADITERKRAEKRLIERQAALEAQTNELEEVNAALRVLLKRRDEDRTELEEKVLSNVKELVLPYAEKLKNSRLDANQKAFLSILESNLNSIVSPFAHTLSSKYLGLTPAEIQTAYFIRDGRSTKEIAGLLNVSPSTIESRRKDIRAKIGIRNRKANLRSYLLST